MNRTWLLFTIFGCIALIRVGLYWLTVSEYTPGQKITLSHTMLEEPRIQYGKQSFTMERILIYAPIEPRISYGDHVVITGTIERKVIEDALTKRKNIRYRLSHPEIQEVKPVVGISFIGKIRASVKESFDSYLNNQESQLLLGVVFGITDGMSQEQYTAFRNTGVLHVIAASGSNISIFTSVLLGVLIYLVKRPFAIAITAVAILLYAVFSGFEPSIIRASLMAIIACSASLIGRQRESVLSLLYTAGFMLIIQPAMMRDVGFQLSVAATGGIITVKPVFDSLIPPSLRGWLADITTSLAAQITTLPIILYTFGSFPVISIFVNMLVLWTVAPLMALGFVAALSVFSAPFVVPLLLFILYPLLSFFLNIVDFFSGLSGTIIAPPFPVAIVAMYYCFLLAVMIMFRSRYEKIPPSQL